MRSSPKVVVFTGDLAKPKLPDVERQAHVVYADNAQIRSALEDADVLFVWDFTTAVLRDAWPDTTTLDWIQIASVGADPLMFPALQDSEIVLTNSQGVFDQAIAEYAAGSIIAICKDFRRSTELQQTRAWEHRESQLVAGSRALVVGAGAIGGAIARMCGAIGMHVDLVGRVARDSVPGIGSIHGVEELDGLLPIADFAILITPLTEQTRGMMGAARLARMKQTAWLLNFARGEVVVESELVDALRSGSIAGAVLDVFSQEPLPPSSPLWSMANVMVSPHMSGDFRGWREELAARFSENFQRWSQGEPLLHQVDRRTGYIGRSGSADAR